VWLEEEGEDGGRGQSTRGRAELIGRAKRDQSGGWLGFRTGVALHEVYLRKPAFAERCAHLQVRCITALSTVPRTPKPLCLARAINMKASEGATVAQAVMDLEES
jgi:hypothetical protein